MFESLEVKFGISDRRQTSLWQLFDFNKASAAKKKGIMFGLGADFGGSFDLKPQSVPIMDPLDGFSNFN